jgi:hypothetical protein
MKPLRPQLRGLISRLTLFYLLLSLPCLILVESTILIFEYESFISDVESGSLVHATERASTELANAWPNAKDDERSALGYWAQAWILRLQRPRGGLIEGESYLLLELADVPLAAAVLGPDGRLIAQAPPQSDWRPELPRPTPPNSPARATATSPSCCPARMIPTRSAVCSRRCMRATAPCAAFCLSNCACRCPGTGFCSTSASSGPSSLATCLCSASPHRYSWRPG